MPRKNRASNLTPNSDRTPEELKAMGSKGGKASAEARRRRKATRELARMVLNMDVVTTRKTKNALKKMGYDVDSEGAPSVELLMQISIANQAISGDLASAKFLYDYAQIPDIHAAIDRERIKAQAEARAKVDLSLNPAEGESVLAEVRRRMAGDATTGAKTASPAET